MDACTIQVEGLVQGVGFRPFIHGLALKHGLKGTVRNYTGGVFIEIEGKDAELNLFYSELRLNPPPLAKIQRIVRQSASAKHMGTFRILSSESLPKSDPLAAFDVATCKDCLAELRDPDDRRRNYPFLNCTRCGPRFTIIDSLPYDRERTSLRAFPLCRECTTEYQNPYDRRFHAQAIACPQCGPKLSLADPSGRLIPTDDPLGLASQLLTQGKIGAIKGLGGFHLACKSNLDAVVAELRYRKRRPEKPFAIMVRDLGAAEVFCHVNDSERALLLSERSPVVLLRKRSGTDIAEGVAPGNALLGVMLPYTPLHHLLLERSSVPLVMTSGNTSDEPIVFDNEQALGRLNGQADFFLMHDRGIQMRCDDSVARVSRGKPLLLRRSRGFAPAPVSIPFRCKAPILALGGQQKVTFAFGRGMNAIVSHHLGDLDSYQGLTAYKAALAHYERLFMIAPEIYVHDLHPDYSSTRLAVELAAKEQKVSLSVQHHHAHMASCMAENGLTHPVIGVTFDGTGLGLDGTIWGGEFLTGDCRSFQRAAHLRAVSMPGGAKAIMEPWRMAVSYLLDAGESPDFLEIPQSRTRLIEGMIQKNVNSFPTSSCGRLLDAAAAILGVKHLVSYEGQAAIELEGMADPQEMNKSYPFELEDGDPPQIDTRPFVSALVRDCRKKVEKRILASRVHATLIKIIGVTCRAIRSRSGLNTVVLSGGVFCNAILTAGASECLEEEGFEVFTHTQVPPNDGGLSLGQLAVAAAQEGNR